MEYIQLPLAFSRFVPGGSIPFGDNPSFLFITMSRKRAIHPSDTPPSKRHLNAALAQELQSLRISRAAPPQTSDLRNPFGASIASSPFLTPPSSSKFATHLNSNQLSHDKPFTASRTVGFGSEFSSALPQFSTSSSVAKDEEPVVISPESSSSSMAIDDDDSNKRGATLLRRPRRAESAMLDVTASPIDNNHDSSTNEDDVVVEEIDELPSSESRVVLYKPPVRMSPASISVLNASLPDGYFARRNTNSHEWFIVPPSDSSKRKLALVPWIPQSKKLRDLAQRPDKVINMPWTDANPTPTSKFDQSMEIEEIS